MDWMSSGRVSKKKHYIEEMEKQFDLGFNGSRGFVPQSHFLLKDLFTTNEEKRIGNFRISY